MDSDAFAISTECGAGTDAALPGWQALIVRPSALRS